MWQDAAPPRGLPKPRHGFIVKAMARKPFTPSPRQARAIRAYLGLTQPAFASACSISDSALYDFEKGRRNTSPSVLDAITAHIAVLTKFKKIEVRNGSIILPE